MVSKLLQEIQNGERTDLKEGQRLEQISIDRKDLQRRVLLKIIPKSVFIIFALEFDYSTSNYGNIDFQSFCDRWNCWDYGQKCIISQCEVRAVLAKLEKANLVELSPITQLELQF